MSATCSVDGCTKEVAAIGLCDTHYRRMHKHGDVFANHRVKHGMYGTPEYATWQSMLARCTNQDHKSFQLYGGRGITVCSEWRLDFARFFSDMGPRPSLAYSLDRIDNNGNYEPANCRWATRRQQVNNRSNTRVVVINGQAIPVAECAEALHCQPQSVRARLTRGWSDVQAATVPLVSASNRKRDWHGRVLREVEIA